MLNLAEMTIELPSWSLSTSFEYCVKASLLVCSRRAASGRQGEGLMTSAELVAFQATRLAQTVETAVTCAKYTSIEQETALILKVMKQVMADLTKQEQAEMFNQIEGIN